jgi:type II secretory pathway pseudopilin PulG
MPELLVIVVIVGILMAIAAPAWNSFLNTRRLNAAQEELFQAIRQAQAQANLTQRTWQASFQESNGLIEFAVHAENSAPIWQTSTPTIHLDRSETTLSPNGNGYRVQFSRLGLVNGQLGRLTLIGDGSRSRRCIIVSTLLGLVKRGKDNPNPDATGRYCY